MFKLQQSLFNNQRCTEDRPKNKTEPWKEPMVSVSKARWFKMPLKYASQTGMFSGYEILSTVQGKPWKCSIPLTSDHKISRRNITQYFSGHGANKHFLKKTLILQSKFLDYEIKYLAYEIPVSKKCHFFFFFPWTDCVDFTQWS